MFTSDITYLSFAAIARCSIPVEKPPVYFSDLPPNFLCVLKWKYSVWIITFLAPPIKERINQCLLIRQFEVCQVVWVRKNVVWNILWDWIGATVMLPTKS
jgi:hypothetical protein